MKTDSLFYKLFRTAPWLLFQLIDRPTAVSQNYKFDAIEIKEVAKRIDGVFVPHQWGVHPIYFVEVQFQKDTDFYHRLFAEIFGYLSQKKVETDWRAVVIFAQRRLEPSIPLPYRWLMLTPHVQKVYLDEMATSATESITLEMVKLIVAKKDRAIQQAEDLVKQIRQESPDAEQEQMLELLEAILLYKLPDVNAEELRKMLVVDDIKKIRVYQEGRAEGKAEGKAENKLESIPRFLKMGLSLEQISEGLDIDIQTVRKFAKKIKPV